MSHLGVKFWNSTKFYKILHIEAVLDREYEQCTKFSKNSKFGAFSGLSNDSKGPQNRNKSLWDQILKVGQIWWNLAHRTSFTCWFCKLNPFLMKHNIFYPLLPFLAAPKGALNPNVSLGAKFWKCSYLKIPPLVFAKIYPKPVTNCYLHISHCLHYSKNPVSLAGGGLLGLWAI